MLIARTTSAPNVQELYAGLEHFYPLECNLISKNSGACHNSDTQLSISIPSLCHLSSPGYRLRLLNLDHLWKYNVSRLRLNRRIDNLKWHPLIWSPVYVYDLDWRSIGVFISQTLQTLHFYTGIFRKPPSISNFLPLTVFIFVINSSSHHESLKTSFVVLTFLPSWFHPTPLSYFTVHGWEAFY